MVADVTVVGTGIIALSAALELADRGLAVRLVGTTHSGNASAAAGGMLAPSIDAETGSAHDFAIASRDYYPGYVAALTARTGRQIPMNDAGIFELAFDELEADSLRYSNDRSARWVPPEELAALAPGIAPCLGGLLHPADGAVEPLALLDALSIAVAAHERITTAREDCRALHASELGCNVLTDMESRFASDRVVLAAGAWTPLIAGSGQCVASVQPVRGQMIAFESDAVRHVICGAGGYLIPRSGGIIVAGGTMEHAGFEVETTLDGVESIRSRAITLCPALANAPIHSSWAGLRPVTPDLQPIIGADPERSRVIHACGHSRNGILLAPLTAQVVADLVTGATPHYDLSRFRPGRH
jgi:glycine oxidase